MPEEWIIDGYNLLYSLPPGISKLAFFEVLANFTAGQAKSVLVVLDGHGNAEELASFCTDQLKIVYAGTVSADSVIERLLYNLTVGARHVVRLLKIRVVTDDRALAQMARGYGALVMGAKDFIQEIKIGERQSQESVSHKNIQMHGFNRPFHDKLNSWNKKLS